MSRVRGMERSLLSWVGSHGLWPSISGAVCLGDRWLICTGLPKWGIMMEMIQESDLMLEASILMISVQPKRPTGAYW